MNETEKLPRKKAGVRVLPIEDCDFFRVDPSADYAEEKRAWEGVPSVARTRGGRLFLSVMSGGIYEPDPRNYQAISVSDDGGESWSLILVTDSVRKDRMRISDIALWVDPYGRLWLLQTVTHYEAGLPLPDYRQETDMENESAYHSLESLNETWVSVCEDPDADELVFTEPRRAFGGTVINKPFVTRNGRWLFPTYLTSPRDFFEFTASDDEGKTFYTVRRAGREVRRSYDEPTFYQVPDGRIAAVLRTRNPQFLRIFSSDGGLTYSEPEPFLAAASMRPKALTLSNGNVLFLCSVHPEKRNGLRLMISENGIDFHEKLVLDVRERVSYPDAVENPDGSVLIVYDRERNNKIRKNFVTGTSDAAKEVLMVRVPAELLGTSDPGEAGKEQTTVLPKVISKAAIHTLQNRFTEENGAGE